MEIQFLLTSTYRGERKKQCNQEEKHAKHFLFEIMNTMVSRKNKNKLNDTQEEEQCMKKNYKNNKHRFV